MTFQNVEKIPLVCDYHDRDNEPCYGEIEEVEIVTEDSHFWVAFCEGHKGVYNGGWYVPKDPIRRLIFSQQNERIRILERENKILWDAIYIADEKLFLQEQKEIEIPNERLEILEYI